MRLFHLLLTFLASSASATSFHGERLGAEREKSEEAPEVTVEEGPDVPLSEWELTNDVQVAEEELDPTVLEVAGKPEGDMNVGNLKAFVDELNNVQEYGRNALRNVKWPTNEIPVKISRQFGELEDPKRKVVVAAMQEIMKQTCVKFVPYSNERDFVDIVRLRGCYSYVGRQGGRQELSLGDGCVHKGVAMHELLHVLGFVHEQSRPDRDDYIQINFDNVENSERGNFEKYAIKDLEHLEEGYDLNSIMHYGETAFTKNGRRTIQVKKGYARIGQRDRLSPIDIREINKLYGCAQARTAENNNEGERPCKNQNWRCVFWALVPGRCDDSRAREICPKACSIC